MGLKLKNKVLLVVTVVILFLLITNPSMKEFKDYIGITSYKGLKRTSNFFIFSIYKFKEDKYFAITGNFWDLKPHVINTTKNNWRVKKSLAVGMIDTVQDTLTVEEKWKKNHINKKIDFSSFDKAVNGKSK